MYIIIPSDYIMYIVIIINDLFEPVQVSTAFSQLSETYHNKGCDQPHPACTLLLERRRRRGARMPTSFGARRIYTSWGVTLFCPTCAEQLINNKMKKLTWLSSGTICFIPECLARKYFYSISVRRMKLTWLSSGTI